MSTRSLLLRRAPSLRHVSPLLGLAVAVFALRAPSADAFSLIGGSLDLDHRDIRIFANFSDAQANSNQTPDPNFPGSVGAELAVWKGAVEWGSMLHGSGQGDPTQPFDLGSGGANFDYTWQLHAPGVGSANDNTNSELSGGSGGVLAFTETPISDGWRIRYYSTWTWEDGPNGDHPFIDLQGVACHELGHALGLGHTSVNGATMEPAISGNGSDQRSIAPDDIAGIQAIYGAKSLSKPRVNGYSVQAGVVTVTGANFSPTNNELWFTRATAQTLGTPVKVVGLAANGTSISAALPATAGPGDVLVRNNGTAHVNLSNAFPFDPLGTVPPPPPAPQLASIAPASLATFSGGLLTLNGSGFSFAKSVQIGAQLLGAFTIVSDTKITCVPPPPTVLGPIDVRVWNANEPSSPQSFTWVDNSPPQLQAAGLAVSNNLFFFNAVAPDTFALEGWPVLTFGVIGGAKPMSALGLGAFVLPIPAGTAGVTFYSQIGALDTSTLTFAGTSTPFATTVLF